MRVYFRNMEFEVHEEVYEPAEDSFLLAGNLMINDDDSVLDIGTGTGIVAITAAEKAGYVLGVDINPIAIEVARNNAKLNKIRNVEFMLSDLFENVSDKFDLITFNPPYLPVEEKGNIEKAWSGGKKGTDVINRFLDSVRDYLKPEGRFQLIISSLNNPSDVKNRFRKNNLKFEITAKEKLPFEEIYVINGCLI